jgi:hypothetical protein
MDRLRYRLKFILIEHWIVKRVGVFGIMLNGIGFGVWIIWWVTRIDSLIYHLKL